MAIDLSKAKPGDLYKTRNGRKARIYATDGWKNYPIHGATYNDNGWRTTTWRRDGFHIGDMDHPTDLIAPWTEPEPKLEAWLKPDFSACTMSTGDARYWLCFIPRGVEPEEHSIRAPGADRLLDPPEGE